MSEDSDEVGKGNESSDSDYKEDGGGSKKKRMDEEPINFLETMAEDSDEDDDDDLDLSQDGEGHDDLGGFVENENNVDDDEDIQGTYMSSLKKTGDEEDIANQLNEKYHDYMKATALESVNQVNKSRYPTLSDPKLFLIRCKPGSERTIATHLLRKYLERHTEGEPMLIYSVVALEHLKGYLYIESEREMYVKNAIQNIQDIFFSKKIKQVPHHEMADVMTIPIKKKPLQKGDWVRVKRGIYRGDIAQVYEYNDATNEVWIRLVPRLDVDNMFKQNVLEEEILEGDESKGKKRKRPVVKAPPPARRFNIEDYMDRGDLDNLVQKTRDRNGESYDVFEGQMFTLDGLLHKKVALKSLDIDGISPSVDELIHFQNQSSTTGTGEENEDELKKDSLTLQTKHLMKLKNKRNVIFNKGDHVIVEEGELKSLIGLVKSVEGETVKIIPLHKDFQDELPVSAKQLSKYFKVGDHVKVITGNYESETGFIIKIQDNIAVILSDINHKELKVLTSDIQLCSEMSSGLKLGNYQLHDLVQLGPQSIGVITRVDREGFEIIDSYGNVKNAKLQEILHKKNSRKAVARDNNKNPVGTGDTIRVIDGKYKGYQGVVKHIVRNFAFVHSPNYKNNSGIFVVNTAKQCKIVGTSKSQTMAGVHGKNPVSNPVPQMRNISRQRSSNRNDPLLHKLVKIKSGNWRGYVGIVKDSSKEKVTVELQTNAQRIQVPRSSVSESFEEKKTISEPTPSRSMTPHRPNTPMVNDPFSTGRTPNHPSTPGYGQEESHDDYDSYFYDSTAHTPFGNSYMETERYTPVTTPGINEVSSPNFNPSSTPTTPGSFHTPHPNTPGHTPTTPGSYNMPPTTPGNFNYNNMPTTPGGYRPNTPGFQPYSTPFSEPKVNNTNNNDDDNNWWTPHIEIEYNGKVGIISSCYSNECEVAWNDGVSSTIEGSLLKPVIPKKKDKVIIIKGKDKGKKGELLQALIEQNEGIIKFEDFSHLVVPLNNIARYVES
jgi:transcription elongation factor SPT5